MFPCLRGEWEEPRASSRRALVLSGGVVENEGSLAKVEASGSSEFRNALWIEIKKEVIDKNVDVLNKSLVGRWGGLFDQPSDLVPLRNWALSIWKLKGNLYLALL